MFKDLLAGCATLVFPPHCLLCHKPHQLSPQSVLCRLCLLKLAWNVPPFCVKCSRHVNTGASLCSNCRRRNVHFDFAYAALAFNAPLKELLHRYKYHCSTALRLFFTECMAQFIRTYQFDMARFDMVIAVPLHSTQLRLRGYNQSFLMAKEIARIFSIPYSAKVLLKRRPTRSQSELKRKERWTNLVGAFTINHSVNLKGLNVLLVDDLLTTGATASAAAKALKEAGCDTVGVLTLAAVI